ncbi:MAG TPA: ribosome-associated translation inhibitor RaiA [Candidatus Accumulibacter phosphatis]|nr:ribosome-associated translation inhibitor RaiA [Candidatus Accumulibacter phosphatis]HRQ95868.1 ribosome-associated translation inhibitor RaiA [Candidatus Accumulibacter phosphatis]
MNLKAQARNFTLTDELREHVSTRLAYSLNHGRNVVTRVVVRLSDVNGPRGGEDKCCGIEVRLKDSPALVVEDTQTDLYVAIDRAAERMDRTLDHHLARRHEFAVVSVLEEGD